MRTPPNRRSRLLTSPEVASIFHVDQRTVVRWARQGKIPGFRTLGGSDFGHWRFREEDIRALLTLPGD
jgi:excisionase family DNA binding protein